MRSIIALPNDYVVIDLETTGRNPKEEEIIELAAIRYRDGAEVDNYRQLVKPSKPIGGFVAMLTGITSAMLDGMPTIDKVISEFADFIGTDILIGHNIAAFDAVFIADAYEKHLGRPLENPCVDTMRLAKKACPGLKYYSLEFLSAHLGVAYQGSHRALADCSITNECYQRIRNIALENGTVEDFCDKFRKKKAEDQISQLVATTSDINADNPLFGKNIVFTGALLLTRAEAMQLAVDFGAVPQKGVTAKTDFLVVGTQDLERVGSDGMSSKEEKAAKLNASGKANIQVITENDFLKMTKR